ncbi:MAG: hypothetical protein ACI9O4_002336 [Chitinophagales bacterium]|jgi:hypothetical protein
MKRFIKQFGGKIDNKELHRLSQSKHWTGKKFENLEETSMDINPRTLPGLLKKQFTGTAGRAPEKNIPIIPFDTDAFNKDSNSPKFIWYGHSVILFRMNGMNILFDPMFGPDASPIAPMQTKIFSEGSLEILKQLPPIDIVLMSHDHYDHLDLASIEVLKGKVKKYIVPLGVGRHLKAWGIDPNSIQELDWWDNLSIENLFIEFTPSRHFTGRGLSDRAKSLWGRFVLKTSKHKIYISGDGVMGAISRLLVKSMDHSTLLL